MNRGDCSVVGAGEGRPRIKAGLWTLSPHHTNLDAAAPHGAREVAKGKGEK